MKRAKAPGHHRGRDGQGPLGLHPGPTCSAESRASGQRPGRRPQGPAGASRVSPGSEAPAREVPAHLFWGLPPSSPFRSTPWPPPTSLCAEPNLRCTPCPLNCVLSVWGCGVGCMLAILGGES